MANNIRRGGELVRYEGSEIESLQSYYLKDDSLWLTQKQISELFKTEVTSIGKHIRNIYDTRELLKKPTKTTQEIEQEEKGRKVLRSVTLFNLDMIISIGYRVNSKRGTQFRMWATKVISDRLKTNGISALTESAVTEVVKVIGSLAQRMELASDEAGGLLQVIIDYSRALQILDDYDHQKLKPRSGPQMDVQPITYDEAMAIVAAMKQQCRSHETAV